MEKRVKIPQ